MLIKKCPPFSFQLRGVFFWTKFGPNVETDLTWQAQAIGWGRSHFARILASLRTTKAVRSTGVCPLQAA